MTNAPSKEEYEQVYTIAFIALHCNLTAAEEPPVIDSMETLTVRLPEGKATAETANPAALPIDAGHGNAPSKLGAIWFGKWWYWSPTRRAAGDATTSCSSRR